MHLLVEVIAGRVLGEVDVVGLHGGELEEHDEEAVVAQLCRSCGAVLRAEDAVGRGGVDGGLVERGGLVDVLEVEADNVLRLAFFGDGEVFFGKALHKLAGFFVANDDVGEDEVGVDFEGEGIGGLLSGGLRGRGGLGARGDGKQCSQDDCQKTQCEVISTHLGSDCESSLRGRRQILLAAIAARLNSLRKKSGARGGTVFFPKTVQGSTFGMGGKSSFVDFRMLKASATCCGVNLVVQHWGFFAFFP